MPWPRQFDAGYLQRRRRKLPLRQYWWRDRLCVPDSMKVSWRQRHGADRRLPAETATKLPRHPYRSVSRVDRSLHHRRSHLRKDRHRDRTSLSLPAPDCARSGWTSSGRCCAATPALRQMFREYVLRRSSIVNFIFLSLLLFLLLLLCGGAPSPRRAGFGRALPKFSLAKSTGNIVFRLALTRICKNFRGRPKLDQLSKIKESGVIGDASGLLHVVRYGYDRVLGFELIDQFLDLGRGDRIKRRTGLIH